MGFAEELAAMPDAPWGVGVCSVQTHAAFQDLLKRRPNAFLKAASPLHFTASALVLDASHQFIALHFHKKIQAWLQFGGHIEAFECSFEDAARREAAEESGLSNLRLFIQQAAPFTLHPHAMGDKYPACSEHWDVQYAFETDFVPSSAQDGLKLSDESTGLQWWPLNELPADLIADLRPTLGHLRSFIEQFGSKNG